MSDELPRAKVLQTTVTPNELGLTVRLQISDGSLLPPSVDAPDRSTIRLDLTVQIEPDGLPLLPRIEWQALRLAAAVLGELERQKASEAKHAR